MNQYQIIYLSRDKTVYQIVEPTYWFQGDWKAIRDDIALRNGGEIFGYEIKG